MKKIISFFVITSLLITTIGINLPLQAESFIDSIQVQYSNPIETNYDNAVENLLITDKESHHEITFDLNFNYTNPFNPEDIEVNGVFSYPSGKTITIPAFYMQEMQYIKPDTTLMVYNANHFVADDEGHWCLRFNGDELGNYSFSIQILSGGNAYSYSDPDYVFNLNKTKETGFIKISEANPNYFVDSVSGKLFYGSGSNIAWVRDAYTSNVDHLSYEYFLSQAAKAQTNITRVWMCHWAWLEWMPKEGDNTTYSYAGLGYYNQCIASSFDKILSLCEDYGIRLVLTLDDNDEHKNELYNGEDTFDSWAYNPYNSANGGPADSVEEYWSNKEVRKYYKNRLRYIIARWGYSTSLMSLNLWNDQSTPNSDIIDYLDELNRYTDSLTENYRPLLFGSNYKYTANAVLDYNTVGMANCENGSKPTLTQECYYSDNPNYFKQTLKQTLWEELFAFNASTMVWSHDSVDESNSWDCFTNLLNFIKDIPFNKYTYSPNYSIDGFVSTWENSNGEKPQFNINNNKLEIKCLKDDFSFATVKLETAHLPEKTVGISFKYDATQNSTDTYFRINLSTKIDGKNYTFMPWYGKTYYFTPDGGETQTLKVSGSEQFKSWLNLTAGTKGTFFIPLDTLEIHSSLMDSEEIEQSYKGSFNAANNEFQFTLQTSFTNLDTDIMVLDDITWVTEDENIITQDFSKYTAQYASSADYELDGSAENFKTVTLKPLGDIATWAHKATENQFYVDYNYNDSLIAGISPTIYGTNANIQDYKNDPTFNINSPYGGEMVIQLNEFGTGTNNLTVKSGDEIITTLTLTGGRRTVNDDERYVRVPLKEGMNSLTISNEGHDWILITAYHFKFYTENSKSAVSVKRMINKNQQLALVRNSLSGEVYSNVFNGEQKSAFNVSVPFYELENAEYRLEIYDTENGIWNTSEIITPTNGEYTALIDKVDDISVVKLTKILLFGDTNSDGKISVADIVRLKKYFSFTDIEIDPDLTDLNIDCKINTLDMVLLKNILLQ